MGYQEASGLYSSQTCRRSVLKLVTEYLWRKLGVRGQSAAATPLWLFLGRAVVPGKRFKAIAKAQSPLRFAGALHGYHGVGRQDCIARKAGPNPVKRQTMSPRWWIAETEKLDA